MPLTAAALLRAALAAGAVSLAAPPITAQVDGPRTRLTCDAQRLQRLVFVDNPMAAAGVNRRLTTGDEAAAGRIEVVFRSAGADATINVPGNLRDGGRPASARVNRHVAGDIMLFLGFDPDDGGAWTASYFPRVGKLILTTHAPRLDGRDRAAQGRSLFADCKREELR